MLLVLAMIELKNCSLGIKQQSPTKDIMNVHVRWTPLVSREMSYFVKNHYDSEN
jgi:hypothetical protein